MKKKIRAVKFLLQLFTIVIMSVIRVLVARYITRQVLIGRTYLYGTYYNTYHKAALNNPIVKYVFDGTTLTFAEVQIMLTI